MRGLVLHSTRLPVDRGTGSRAEVRRAGSEQHWYSEAYWQPDRRVCGVICQGEVSLRRGQHTKRSYESTKTQVHIRPSSKPAPSHRYEVFACLPHLSCLHMLCFDSGLPRRLRRYWRGKEDKWSDAASSKRRRLNSASNATYGTFTGWSSARFP